MGSSTKRNLLVLPVGDVLQALQSASNAMTDRAAKRFFMTKQSHLIDSAQRPTVDVSKSALRSPFSSKSDAIAFLPFGFTSKCPDAAPTLLFNGEKVESSGIYLLGGGYHRPYNPRLMRFHSPDTLSPFGAGGINAYAYCLGDSINYADPTGHTRAKNARFVGAVKKVIQNNRVANQITPRPTPFDHEIHKIFDATLNKELNTKIENAIKERLPPHQTETKESLELKYSTAYAKALELEARGKLMLNSSSSLTLNDKKNIERKVSTAWEIVEQCKAQYLKSAKQS